VGTVNLTTELTWNALLGQRETVKTPDLLVTRWDYDNFGRVVKETRPAGHTDLSYDDCYVCWPQNARLSIRARGSDGKDSYQFLDELQRPVGTSWTLPLGTHGRREIRYNGLGQVSQASQPYVYVDPVFWVTYQYDLLGRLTQENAPVNELETSGAITKYEYRGHELWVTDAEDHTTKYVHNAPRQIKQVIDALNGTTAYTYKPFGELYTVTDPETNVTEIGYDSRGFKSSMIDPNMGSWSYNFNLYGELASQTNALSQTTTMTYDEAGRIKTRAEPEGTTTFNYYTSGAGAKGKPYTISKTNHSELYEYSPTNGEPTLIRRTLDGTAYDFDLTFDGQGRLDVLTYPDISGYRFKIDYDYDYFGHMNVAKDGNTGSVFYTLTEADALGREVFVDLGNGLDEYRTFDRASGHLTAIETGPSLSSSIQDLSFTFDEVGNLETRTNHLIGKTETFTYDALNRLSTAQVSGLSAATTTYSAAGRITSKTDVPGTWSYGAGPAGPNALTSVGSVTYGYDANGRMTNHGGDTLTWYSYDLPQVLRSGTKSAEFSYGVGRDRYKQIQKTGSTTDATIYYVGTLFEKEIAGSTTTYRHHVSARGRTIATVSRVGTANTVQYLHRDHQNSVVEVTSSSGTLVQSLAYDAWGLRRNAANWSALGSPFGGPQPTERGYTGHEHLDSVELIHMNGRVQDPKLGRFISADPFVQAPFNPQSLNRYSYVWNNPTSLVDPSGFGTLDDESGPPPGPPPIYPLPELPESCLGNHPSCDDRYANYDPETAAAAACANGTAPCAPVAEPTGAFVFGIDWSLVGDSLRQMAPDDWRDVARNTVRGVHSFPLGGAFDSLAGVGDVIGSVVSATEGDFTGAVIAAATSKIPGGGTIRKLVPKATPRPPSNAPDFIVSPGGTAYPVPRGATGPTPVINPAGRQTGSAFAGGRGGANQQVDSLRVMDPTPPRGSSPGYPRGYVKYENRAGQGVDPYTGQTVPNSQSHFPID
jgi:RHS repeat-associated protein